MKKLLIASGNQGKIREIRDRYQKFALEIIGQEQFPELEEVIEDGSSFRENALKKARTRARETGLITLADDSGLVVDYLDGRPGIYSARYGGQDATDLENNRKLLRELEGVPREKRKAHFKCVAALFIPGEESITVSGICRGYIAEEMKGDQGFGYDPLFYVPEYEKTMAELPLVVKNKISHRARALDKMEKHIQDLVLQ
ncbi:MAG: XTP/dITP diphosphatase [Bacillota bacterium]